MSALALKSLRPAIADRSAIWVIGGIGAAISVLSSTWLDQLANFTLVLAGLFVPVGGILLAHFVLHRSHVTVDALYPGTDGTPAKIGRWSVAGMSAWIVGGVIFYLAQPIGGVVPSLAVSIAVYLGVRAAGRG
jgi:purine-cytosine permease-like protein